MSEFEVGDVVEYLTIDDGDHWSPIGVVAGFGSVKGHTVVLVRLNKGVWTENRTMFISLLPFHPSNIQKGERGNGEGV